MNITPGQLGNPEFSKLFNTQYAYMAGAMANGIASEKLVIALGQAGMLGSFGAAGLSLSKIKQAIEAIQTALSNKPYCFNLIHTPDDESHEQAVIDLYLQKNIKLIEASAFMRVTLPLVYFRAAGQNNIIAKVSHPSVAEQFMSPPPEAMLKQLVQIGKITEQQASRAAALSLADAVTIEADSGGHTDNQSLVCLFPVMRALRNRLQQRYKTNILLGAAGGIGSPDAIVAALAMGADYVVTGSINQASVEAGTSLNVKKLLATLTTHDVTMAPAPDMFEIGAKVQVAKRGCLFAQRAQKLHQIYSQYDALESLPANIVADLEKNIFQQSLTSVWQQARDYWKTNKLHLLAELEQDSKRKLAAVCKWYMGNPSDWATSGDVNRTMDYQIWCGPAMGAFNDWAAGTPLADISQRFVASMAKQLLQAAAELQRANALRLMGMGNTLALTPLSPPKPIAPIVPQPAKKPTRDAAAIRAWLTEHIAAELNCNQDTIDIRQPFANFQINSAKAMLMLAKLEKWLNIKLSQTIIWSYPTVEALAKRLAALPMASPV